MISNQKLILYFFSLLYSEYIYIHMKRKRGFDLFRFDWESIIIIRRGVKKKLIYAWHLDFIGQIKKFRFLNQCLDIPRIN